MCEQFFNPTPHPSPTGGFDKDVTWCPQQIKNHSHLIKILAVCMFTGMGSGSMGWLKLLTHLLYGDEIGAVCVCVCWLCDSPSDFGWQGASCVFEYLVPFYKQVSSCVCFKEKWARGSDWMS